MSEEAAVVDIRYRVELDLTARDDGATSRTEIRFRSTAPGRTAQADVALARLHRLELNGVELEPSSVRNGHLTLAGLQEVNVLVVTGEVDFAGGRDGLCTFTDDTGARFVYLHLPARAPASAAEVMACFIGAGRAEIELAVVAPAGWTVVSHATPTEQPEPGQAGTWRFVAPLPMEPRPTFAAGPWASRDGVHVRPSLQHLLDDSPIAGLRDDVVRVHERLLDVAHPYDQLPCVLVPGYGSQGSNAGGLMMCHERVLHASVAPEWRGYVLWVLAHEAAHSWFGGVFERRRPEDHWLYEGVATYLCHRAMEQLAPDLASWARYHLLEEAEAHEVDASEAAHPIAAMPLAADEGATRGLPPLVYGKPAAVLRHLEGVVGRDAVDAALGALLRDHREGVADTADFIRAAEAASGVDLGLWADDWLFSAGVNTLTVDVECAVVQQAPSTDGRRRTHLITVQAFDLTAAGLVRRSPIELEVTGETTEVPELLGAPPPDLVIPNAPATSYVRVRLDERSRATLGQQLGALPPETRAVCWVAAMEMVRDGLMPSAELRAWTAAHAHVEQDPQVRDLLAAA